MRSIHKHLNRTMFLLIVFIYTFFLLAFFSINFFNVYDNTKSKLKNMNQFAQNTIEDHFEHVEFYNDQVEDIFQFKLQDNNILAVTPFLNETEIQLLDILFKNNKYFENFMIINNLNQLEYSYQRDTLDNLNLDALKELSKPNGMILTNRLKSNHLTIIYMYNSRQYFIYYYCEESLNDLSQYNTIIQDKMNKHFLDTEESVKIPYEKSEGLTPFFEDDIFNYYKKVEYFDHHYYFITQVSRKEVMNDVYQGVVVPFMASLAILVFLFILTYIEIIKIIKKPYDRFIYEVESLEEKDISYLSSINEFKIGYIEFSKILLEFKKICIYNKNNYENIIQGLKNNLSQAQEGNKSKSLFLANMSHEMRTPLNSIIGYTQLTKKVGFDNQAKVIEYFNCISNSSEILLQKVNDILDLSKIESKQFELHEKPTQIVLLIKDIYDLLSIQAEKKGIEFTYYIDPQIPQYLDVDNTRLKQILINLTSNAIKFTDEGSVRLEIEVFGYTSDSVLLEYIISDTGVGIPKDKIDTIFVPFVQVPNNNSKQIGTGLGLTIARDLIRLMGGDINVTSKEDVGSIFSFITKFKISHKEENEKTSMIDVDNEIFIEKIKNKNILICEDNLINQIFMKEIFSVFNKKDVDIASDGFEAVSMCKDKKYDIILMDIQMPKMNGIEATKIIKALDSYIDVPIIALTANAFSEQINEYLLIGMNDYLPKPVDIKRFKSVLVNQL